MLLEDQLSHEQICITKYSGYASRTRDPEIRRMFHEFASDEQQHYDTINNLLQQSGQSQGQWQAKAQQQPGSQAGKRHQAGSQGAGWQATAQPGGTGIQSFGMTGNVGQTGRQSGHTLGGQPGSHQATSGGGAHQNWMSETRTVYGGQISQGSQSRDSLNFEAGSELSMSTSDDKSMLEDMLMTEKYISGAYDTAVFETSNQEVRQALQHIQRDEQKHGERIFQYMQQRGMYQPQ
jgi:spore coat protein CotF